MRHIRTPLITHDPRKEFCSNAEIPVVLPAPAIKSAVTIFFFLALIEGILLPNESQRLVSTSVSYSAITRKVIDELLLPAYEITILLTSCISLNQTSSFSQSKMKLSLVTVVAIVSSATVDAFAPKSKLVDAKSSFEALTKKSSESTLLKSSRAEPLVEEKVKPAKIKNSFSALTGRIPKTHKKWGVDNATPVEYFEEAYWADSRIHTLGNLGILGAVCIRIRR